ncbi:MAG: flagellar basal body P-ring formation chaperone FlgA [Burkholderiales bacterium]
MSWEANRGARIHSVISQGAALLRALLLAATATSTALARDPEQSVRLLLEAEATRLPGRVELEIGRVDERIKLAPCAAPEPFIPNGSRLWGKTHLGVRCKDGGVNGAQWSVLVPVHIKVFAAAPVATRALPAGGALSEDDYRIEEVELTREAPGILSDPSSVADFQITRAIAAGAPLRRDHFRPRPVVAPGDPVKLLYLGAGFNVTGQGKALHAGLEGQSVRVQTESGRVLTGIARAGRTVELRF